LVGIEMNSDNRSIKHKSVSFTLGPKDREII